MAAFQFFFISVVFSTFLVDHNVDIYTRSRHANEVKAYKYYQRGMSNIS